MQDVEVFRQLLGLTPPWEVTRVELKLAEGHVDVHVGHAPGTKFPCAKCGKELPVADHAEERTWRHLDTFQYETRLRARVPRVDCGEHGKLQVRVPWAEPRSRFTLMFEALAIDVLRQTSVSGAAKILRLSWDEAMHLMRRAVARGEARKAAAGPSTPTRIGVDEKAIAKRHRYATLVVDLERAVVEAVQEGRKTESLGAYYEGLTAEARERVECIAMDMWQGYLAATRKHIPNADAKVVHDRFHIMQHANKAVDQVRRAEHTRLLREGDSTLSKTRYLWLYGRENVPDHKQVDFQRLRKVNLATGKAWLWKEDLRLLWTMPSLADGKRYLDNLARRAKRMKLRPVAKVAQMLKDHAPQVLNYFRFRVTNAAAESVNAILDRVQRRAAGFRSFASMRLAVLFHCGGLDVYPALPAATPGKV
jgi:transposase